MEKRLQSLKNSRAFKMTLYLDPRLNYAGSKLFSYEEKEEIQGYITELWHRIRDTSIPISETSCDLPASNLLEDENDILIAGLFGSSTVSSGDGEGSGFMQQLKAVEVEPRRGVKFDVWEF
ncbi:uncharacterized protein LOC129733129 [Wyeomyia smithii]|uniref:uncharacterized protein LOC129733129 n=1 Tax=Wyeomyia smithii TaxID=174621 RepID=UPI002467D698|nr:uncharacterized protein LOC129733129 [Wyeomyia smithii]